MTKQTKQFLAIILITYILVSPLRDLLVNISQSSSLDKFAQSSYYLLTVSSFLCFMLYSFLAYYLFSKQFKKQSLFVILLILTLCCIPIICLRYLIQEVFFEWAFGFHNYNTSLSFSYYVLDNFYYAIIFSMIGLAYYFVQYAIDIEQKSQELLIQTKKTELAFLRSQLNPHFLFNCMNNIYALINKGSKHALTAVDKLSTMLRYALYQEDQVTLKQEINYIRDYIQIQQFRYKEPLAINLQTDANTEQLVSPFIFVPFIENAFKHGELQDTKQPIQISFKQSDNRLVFTCSNQIREQEKDEQGGIGLENTKKRLELIYAERHQLEIQMSDTQFQVCLELVIE